MRDSLSVLQSSELSESEASMTGMELILYNRELAESQVKNRMRTITFDRV